MFAVNKFIVKSFWNWFYHFEEIELFIWQDTFNPSHHLTSKTDEFDVKEHQSTMIAEKSQVYIQLSAWFLCGGWKTIENNSGAVFGLFLYTLEVHERACQKKLRYLLSWQILIWWLIKVQDSKLRKDLKLLVSIFIKRYLRPKFFRRPPKFSLKMTGIDNHESI
jgi:hypothetical protein